MSLDLREFLDFDCFNFEETTDLDGFIRNFGYSEYAEKYEFKEGYSFIETHECEKFMQVKDTYIKPFVKKSVYKETSTIFFKSKTSNVLLFYLAYDELEMAGLIDFESKEYSFTGAIVGHGFWVSSHLNDYIESDGSSNFHISDGISSSGLINSMMTYVYSRWGYDGWYRSDSESESDSD
jgi:hypothetical protein